jgi:trk system potassium uptake protein
MKIIILGAGQVGGSVALSLARESHDVTVVDRDAHALQTIQDRADLRTVLGHAAHPSTLEQAGADDAGLLIAVTDSDETNLVACEVAYTLYHTPTRIARVRSAEYLAHPKLFAPQTFPIDVAISPELAVTRHIERLIDHPGALQVLEFADGKVQLVAVRAHYGGPLVGQELRTLTKHMPGVQTRVAAIFRRGRAIHPEGDTVVEADDEVFFIAPEEHIAAVTSELRKQEKPFHRIFIAGGGHIGEQLARALAGRYQVKLIEHNEARAHLLSDSLEGVIVLAGDAADRELLIEENIESADVFCALTNDDETNILSAMLAKRLGVRQSMCIINRPSYVELVEQGSTIDIVISPQQVTIGKLLAHIRRGDVVAVHSLRKGAAEAIEAVAHGDKSNSKVVGRSIEEIDLPAGANIGAIVRKGQVLMAHHDTVIESEDHVILFVTNKRRIPDIERLFQVGLTFF